MSSFIDALNKTISDIPLEQKAVEAIASDKHPRENSRRLAREVLRSRTAIKDAIRELEACHYPQWISDEAKAAGKDPIWCATCGSADGDWPCTSILVVDDLRKLLVDEQENRTETH